MSAAAFAATPVAPHPEPPRAAAGARPRGGGTSIKVPLRLVVGAQYPDVALSVYVKVKALSLRPEGCTARVVRIAEFLGTSKSSVERGLKPLRNPDPVDGITEVPTVRRTLPGGQGESAHRVTRPLTDDELWVLIPIRAAEVLTPRLLRVYALLAYADARAIPVTVAELGEMLHHHSGKKAGEHLSEWSARRLVRELAATGWITVHDRDGDQGRNAYETHRHPLHTVPTTVGTSPACADRAPEPGGQLPLWGDEPSGIHDGSGPSDHDGSLATEEDLQIDRREKTELGGGIRRRRGDRKRAAAPVDNPLPDTFGRGPLGLRPDPAPTTPPPASGRAPYTGPSLRLSPRVWRTLAPVHHELPAISPYMLRRIARELGAQLDAPAGSEERLTDRIARRYASTDTIRDIGRWLLGAALPRRGCGDPRCESEVIWDTGADCATCALNRQVEQARAARNADIARRLDELQQQRLRRAASARGQDQADAEALPPKLTYRQRSRASDAEIRAAIAEHGLAVALHLYGHLRTLPLLHGHTTTPEPGSDRRTHAQ